MPFNPVERLRFLPLPLLGAGCGLLSVLAVGWLADPEPQLRRDPFQLIRSDDEPLEITGLMPRTIPFPFGDFDAVAELELPAGADLDLAFRVVEPKVAAEPFHARFGVLRLSTVAEAPGFLTREEALFARRVPGGVRVGAGHPSTVHLEARGHLVRANVAGRQLPWVESADDFGALAFVLRGEGKALLRYLNIQPLMRTPVADPWLWAGATGAALGLLFSLFGVGIRRGVAALLALPAAGLVAGAVVFSLLLPQTRPSTTGVLAALLACLPLALAIAARVRWRGALLAGLAVVVLWELTARVERPRLAPLEDPRLSAYFGRGSGSMPLDVLVGELSATTAIHRPQEVARRIVFAGGGHWFEAGGSRGLADNLAPIAAARTTQLVGTEVDGVVVPTLWSTVDQQLALLAEFVAPRFEPDLVVLAISSDELEVSEIYPPRMVIDGEIEPPGGCGSVLLAAWRRSLQGEVAPGTPATVTAALERLAVLAAEHGFAVALYRPEPLPPALDAVVRAAGDTHGWPVLDRPAGATTVEVADRHAHEYAALLKP